MYLKAAQKILLACIFCIICVTGYSQDIPKTIPPFNMVLADGVTYHNADKIEKGKPLMIVYFDPECQHCQAFTKDMVKAISKFSNDQVVMICSAPGLPPLKRFIEQFSLDKYANIKVGTEGMYHATMNFYKVDVTPFVALYDKNGALISFYRNVPAPTKLAKQLNLTP